MSIERKKRDTKTIGKWWRKQESSGKFQNRRIYAKVAQVNPHDPMGPSRLLLALFVRAGRSALAHA